MHKLYKQTENGLRYWEVWQNGKTLVIHTGMVGTRGSTDTRKVKPLIPADKQMERLTEAQAKKGFSPIASEDHETVILQLPMSDDMDTDLDRRNNKMEQLDELVGWIGAGHVDGADYGSGTMNIFIMTVSSQQTCPAIIKWLEETASASESVLAVESQDETQSPQVVWPTDYDGQFRYF